MKLFERFRDADDPGVPGHAEGQAKIIRWQLTFRIRARAATSLSARALRPWWTVFPDQPGALLTDGSLLLVATVEAPSPRLALLIAWHRVTEFFPGRQHHVEQLTLRPEDW